LLKLETWTSFVTNPKTQETYIGQLPIENPVHMLVGFETREESDETKPSPFVSFAGR
jgi:hypothetical protein